MQQTKYSWLPKAPKLIVIIPTSIIVIIGILLILYAWQLPPFFLNVVATNDAFIQSKTTLLSPQVSGYVTDIYVKDFEVVKKGQPILQIDKRIFTQKVNEAEANLASAKSNLDAYDKNYQLREADIAEKKAQIESIKAKLYNAQKENDRVSSLVAKGSLSKRDYDNAHSSLLSISANLKQAMANYQKSLQELEAYKTSKEILEAGVKKAEASLEMAMIDLDNSLIKSPIDGKLGEVGARLGQFVGQGTSLVYVIPDIKWVIANIKETKMNRVAIGQDVSFSVDAMGDKVFRGKVEEIAPGTGSEFSQIKVNNATGNFIKVIQRVPVKIAITDDDSRVADLRAGMSVVVEVHVK